MLFSTIVILAAFAISARSQQIVDEEVSGWNALSESAQSSSTGSEDANQTEAEHRFIPGAQDSSVTSPEQVDEPERQNSS